MAKFKFDIPRWGKTDNILIFLLGSIAAGFAFGVGSQLAELIVRGGVRKIVKETDIIPDEIGEEVVPQYDKLYNLDPATGKPYTRQQN